jgi:hypothetical protein
MGLRNMHEASKATVTFWTSIVFAYVALVVFIGSAGIAFRSIVWVFHPGWSWLVAGAALLVMLLPLVTWNRLHRAEPLTTAKVGLVTFLTLSMLAVPLVAFLAFYGDPVA